MKLHKGLRTPTVKPTLVFSTSIFMQWSNFWNDQDYVYIFGRRLQQYFPFRWGWGQWKSAMDRTVTRILSWSNQPVPSVRASCTVGYAVDQWSIANVDNGQGAWPVLMIMGATTGSTASQQLHWKLWFARVSSPRRPYFMFGLKMCICAWWLE